TIYDFENHFQDNFCCSVGGGAHLGELAYGGGRCAWRAVEFSGLPCILFPLSLWQRLPLMASSPHWLAPFAATGGAGTGRAARAIHPARLTGTPFKATSSGSRRRCSACPITASPGLKPSTLSRRRAEPLRAPRGYDMLRVGTARVKRTTPPATAWAEGAQLNGRPSLSPRGETW